MIIDERSEEDLSEELRDFLEHHGVKGMKWGQRRAARRERFRSLSRKQKVGVAGASIAGALIGSNLGSLTGSSLVRLAGTGGGALAGAGMVYKVLGKQGKRRVSDIVQPGHPLTEQEASRQIQEFLKANPTGRIESN